MNAGINYSEPSYHNIAHDVDALEKNIEEYPFSSLTRYLLLSRYSKTGHPDFEKVLKKTALYFNNHHWLQFQLSGLETESPKNVMANDISFKPALIENQGQKHFAVATDDQLYTNQRSNDLLPEEENFIPHTRDLGYPIENRAGHNNDAAFDNATGNDIDYTPGTENLGTHVENIESLVAEPFHENVVPADFHKEELSVPHTQTLGLHIENIPESTVEHGYENTYNDSPAMPETQSLGSHFENIPGQNEEQYDSVENKPEENISEDQAAEIKNSDTAGVIAFEPLHTVDYFASQGIRITEEALASDKLGTQMKSFTEWLKSMKKLHPSKVPVENSLADDIIQSAADVSNIDTEVLTEAMAEVLIKQDKKEKAIEMYNKLSLINPSKIAYFAAKIESIKST